jgi:hypothetical protein
VVFEEESNGSARIRGWDVTERGDLQQSIHYGAGCLSFKF